MFKVNTHMFIFQYFGGNSMDDSIQEQIDKTKNMSFGEIMEMFPVEDKEKILALPLSKILSLYSEDERDDVKHYYRITKYVNNLNEIEPLNEGRSYEALNKLIKDKLPLVMRDKSWFPGHFKDIKSGKISVIEFLSYFLQYLGEKKLAKDLGLDNPFLLASTVRTTTNIIRQHIREI